MLYPNFRKSDKHLIYRGTKIRITLNFSKTMQARRQWRETQGEQK